jgi:hypothetical protein
VLTLGVNAPSMETDAGLLAVYFHEQIHLVLESAPSPTKARSQSSPCRISNGAGEKGQRRQRHRVDLSASLGLPLAIGVLVVSFRYHRRSMKIGAGLALLFVFIAGLGGYFFVLSGFSAGWSSVQMGGSFIGAYTMYFITLYYTK